MRLVGIGGEPATGKTLLLQGVMSKLGFGLPFKAGLVEGVSFQKTGVYVLGKYAEGDPYGGTDWLSMAVHPAVLDWLLQPALADQTVLFEGDRLFTGRFLERTGHVSERWFFMLTADDLVKEVRRQGRGDTKTSSWLKGRVTKYQRMLEGPEHIEVLPHNTLEENAEAEAKVLAAMGVKA